MIHLRYELVGHSIIDSGEQFGFVIPIFCFEGKTFQLITEDFTDKIVRFVPINCKYSTSLPAELFRSFKKIGEPALFFYIYKGTLHYGNKLAISVSLIKLIKYEKISSIDLYDIYSFIGISKEVDESINSILKEYSELGLTRENFYKAEKKKIDYNQFKEMLSFYSKLIELTGKKIVYTSYFPKSVNEKSITFNDFYINKSELENSFDDTISAKESAVYRDLVVHTFMPMETEFNLSYHPQYRLRQLIDMNLVTKAAINKNNSLIVNSQSPNRKSDKSTELGWKVTSELPDDEDYDSQLANAEFEVTPERLRDAQQTMAILERIKMGDKK